MQHRFGTLDLKIRLSKLTNCESSENGQPARSAGDGKLQSQLSCVREMLDEVIIPLFILFPFHLRTVTPTSMFRQLVHMLTVQLNQALSGHSIRRQKIGFQDRLSLNAGQKYCRMLSWSILQREHSAILLTFIKLPFAIKIFVLSTFEWPLKTGYIVVGCFPY